MLKTFKINNHPEFAQKPEDIVGLYLNPSEHATHKHPKVQPWFQRHSRFHMHFTPTGAS